MKNLITSQAITSFKPILILLSIFILEACNETKSAQHEDNTAISSTVAALTESQTPPPSASDSIEFDQFEELYLIEETTDSIWPRVRDGFKISDDIKHKSLQRELAWFAKHPNYMQRVMQRADPFLYYILEEAEKRNLPTELVLLPIVESAYQPFAYSHGRAAGIWQFIPSTGKSYGLKQNWWYDGRRDIYASTQAALNYLEKLNKHFKGDWMLALAA